MSWFNARRIAVAMASFGLGCVVACAAPGASSTSSDQASTEDGELTIEFPEMFSAFDGSHDFKIPAKVDGVKKLKWSSSDPDAVTFESQADGSTMITIKKAGTFTITAKSGSLTGTAPLTVTSATADDWESGNQRYNNGVVISYKGNHDKEDGAPPQDKSQASCTNCHGDTSKMDVQHTPMQTGGYSDDELITIFTKGKKPDGVPQRIMPADKWSAIHQWSMPDDATKGVVVYLRSLEPKSQGVVDFQGPPRGGKDGGGGNHHHDDDAGTPPSTN